MIEGIEKVSELDTGKTEKPPKTAGGGTALIGYTMQTAWKQ